LILNWPSRCGKKAMPGLFRWTKMATMGGLPKWRRKETRCWQRISRRSDGRPSAIKRGAGPEQLHQRQAEQYSRIGMHPKITSVLRSWNAAQPL